MKVAVGSTNPVKVRATQLVVARVWPAAEVAFLDAPSGVRPMPMSDEEAIAGATNRARAARQQLQADLGLGLEGGVNRSQWGLLLVGWVVAVGEGERQGLGSALRLPLPPSIARRVLAGAELGPLMDELLGDIGVKRKGGAVGALTAGLVPRQETFAMAVAYALSPFVTAHFYG